MSHHKVARMLSFLVLMSMLASALVACGPPPPPAIGAVVAAKSLDSDYAPVTPTGTYMPEDTFEISVEIKDIVIGTVVEVKYMLDGSEYYTSTLTADADGSGYYGFSLTPGDGGHTPGNYTAEVYLNGVLANSVAFTVVPSGPPAIGAVISAKSLDPDYLPVDPTVTYLPSETFYVSVQVENLVVGSVVSVKYLFGGEVYQESTLTADVPGSGFYGFSLSAGADGHPEGTYTVEVYLDGNLAQTISLIVMP